MRVLFLALTSPYPPTTGHRLRTWAMLRALAGEGHRITLLALGDPEEVLEDGNPLDSLCERLEVLPAIKTNGSVLREYTSRGRALFSSLPYGAWRLRSPNLSQRLGELLQDNPFDVVICDGIYNVQNLPPTDSVPLLLNKDDVAHVIFDRYLKTETNLIRRLYASLEARKVRRWESEACARMTAVLACSDVDRRQLAKLCDTRVLVLPNVVDTDHYLPAEDSEPFTVLFQGGMDWRPNQDAVEFFASEILPALRNRVPDARFRVAGRPGPFRVQQRLARQGVEFTGFVPDIRLEIARATVCAVPLRIGSGTRLKILEAGAMAKPIVSTSIGAEGLSFRHPEEILLADQPADFAASLASLLKDRAKRVALGTAARRRVEHDHGLAQFQASLKAALETVHA